ncbi:hypothetical protein QN277_010369 [Acacia crassicarpa]|uniref:Uncharacterized protein n=1 Tax=Acacia crassicarpa TaxID=499986 RepID=A0AAE1JLL9_9FABA|nr:hypothetical protein QN277_010369 [Acacia crassicarpa]
MQAGRRCLRGGG